jgi:hypothetical protein
MTLKGWQAAVEKAKRDPEMARLMAQLLFEQDKAKNALREKGYGCTGMPWHQMVEEVPPA